ncbi:MarR family winged helix-turn-helix transcriptional regulator [Pseudonocardia tropica]|uniref:MarR family winged helix-turn-helix transcriptional regulator n=1 Tax=Pseudonocardia tropica TaxID=681289 RepID=A0ABV1JRD3_9PSEU
MATTPRAGSAFLLAQLGAHAAARFADRVAALELTPPQAGLLRAVASGPGRSQQALASHLGMPPSRLVAVVDELAGRDLLERRRNPQDRRLHALHLTAAGERAIARIGQVARAHDDDLLAVLDADDRATLHALLTRVAADQGLTPGVHPGFRRL